MKFSYSWLKELNPKIGAPQKVADLLTFHAFQVESVERHSKDYVLDLEVLANRMPDAASHIGIASELAAIQGETRKDPEPKIKESSEKAGDLVSVKIQSKNLVSRYSARVMTGVSVGKSPAWMKDRLEACGLRPINVVVDVTNYVMLETGQPLHAFDYDRLRGGKKKEIIVRLAKSGETMDMLGDDPKRLKLESTDLVIADGKSVIGLAGIKGGKGAKIEKGTTRIVIEAANFDRTAIRHTSKRFGLKTDASIRFEHGMDPERTVYALNRASELIAKFAGGKVLKGVIDVYTKRPSKRAIPLRTAHVDSLLGTKVPDIVGIGILQRLGCETKKISQGTYRIVPPSRRMDLNIEEDLIEEIGRIWGYEKIKPEIPVVRGGVPAKNERQIFEDRIKEYLASFGFTESHLSSFTGESELVLFGVLPKGYFELANPTSPDTTYLVSVAATKYVRSVAENLRNFDRVRVFGIARAFFKTDKGPVERRRLIIALAEKGKDGREEFYALKGTVDALLESFGISDHWYNDAGVSRHTWAHPHRVAEIKVGDTSLGSIGEVSSEICERLKVKSRIVVATFDVDWLLDQIESEQEFRPIAKFPAIVRDVAIILPEDVKTESVMNVIESASGNLLIDVDLFDYFQDEAMTGDGRKSLAFHLVFQSSERTLRDEEVAAVVEKILTAFRAKDWEVRE